jgi:hypothetical protein
VITWSVAWACASIVGRSKLWTGDCALQNDTKVVNFGYVFMHVHASVSRAMMTLGKRHGHVGGHQVAQYLAKFQVVTRIQTGRCSGK